MKQIIPILVVLSLAMPAMAMASVQTVNVNDGSTVLKSLDATWQGVEVHVQSLATNAIDTVHVGNAISPKVFTPVLAADDSLLSQAETQQAWLLYVAFEGSSGTGGSGTVDSMQVAIDVSNDKRNWTQAQALTLYTNAAPVNGAFVKFSATAGKGLELPAPFIRLRCKNTGAATGRGYVTVTWQKGD